METLDSEMGTPDAKLEAQRMASPWWLFLLATAAAWTLAALGGLWLLDSPPVNFLPGGFLALLVVGLFGTLLITLAGWALPGERKFLTWFLANLVGLASGMLGLALADTIARADVVRGTTGIPLLDWVLWLSFVFVIAAVGSLPGGLLAGVFRTGSVGKGSVISWAAVSALNWTVSFGAASVLLQLSDFSSLFYFGNFHTLPVLIRGGSLGLLIGLIQGLVLGWRLNHLPEPEVEEEPPEMTEEDIAARLDLVGDRE